MSSFYETNYFYPSIFDKVTKEIARLGGDPSKLANLDLSGKSINGFDFDGHLLFAVTDSIYELRDEAGNVAAYVEFRQDHNSAVIYYAYGQRPVAVIYCNYLYLTGKDSHMQEIAGYPEKIFRSCCELIPVMVAIYNAYHPELPARQ